MNDYLFCVKGIVSVTADSLENAVKTIINECLDNSVDTYINDITGVWTPQGRFFSVSVDMEDLRKEE